MVGSSGNVDHEANYARMAPGPRLDISFGKPQFPWQSLRKCHGAVRAAYVLPSLQEK